MCTPPLVAHQAVRALEYHFDLKHPKTHIRQRLPPKTAPTLVPPKQPPFHTPSDQASDSHKRLAPLANSMMELEEEVDQAIEK